MDVAAHIGQSIVIKGNVTANEPITVAGRIEGTIDVSGHQLTVTPEGQVHGDITAQALIVAGKLRGDAVAEKRVELRNTADVEGALTAPAVSMAEGAFVRGKVHASKKATLAQAS
jgi:cytoskeletal protein CcmA (bactofilin family)